MKATFLQRRVIRTGAAVLPMLTMLAAVATPGAPVVAQTAGFADAAFQRVWERTDLPVQQGKVARSWVWGPTPGNSLKEPFKESPGGSHLVQYFDKARMEINFPGQSSADPFYVTNGLLAVEMISGKMQTGADLFESFGASTQVVAGENGSDAPSYAALQSVASVGLPNAAHRAAPIAGGVLMPSEYINSGGVVSRDNPVLTSAEAMKSAGFVSETGHNIPQVFWNFLNAQGPLYDSAARAYVDGPIVNWVSAFGYPITEPYWTTIKVGDKSRLIMFQAFQRRILTYSPANAAAWKVEMGNVGAQYYTWRYSNPMPVCQKVPLRGFGRVWAGDRNVARTLGCPLPYPPFDKETAINTAFEPFERGSMLFVDRTSYTREQLIYVFFDDGTFQQFDNSWKEGDPVNSGLTPPKGLFEPIRGFGKVWREGTGARVRERLGWAKAPETGGNGAYQRFDRGEMYWSSTVNKIWVLFNSVNGPSPLPPPGAGQAPPTYQVYDDTFNP